MRKSKKAVIAVILASMMVSAVGCNKSAPDAGNTTKGDVATFDSVSGKEVMIYDYDDLSDFQEINATQAFGVTKMNTDPKYIKSGSGSMYIKVEGYEEMYHHPEKVTTEKQVIEMYPNWFFEQKGEFGDALCFKLDAYNISDRDIEITLYFETANTQIALGPEIAVRNQWSELVFEVDRERAYYWGMDSVKLVQLAFEGRTQGQTAAELYIDNFRYVQADKKAEALGYVPTINGNMLCDYEDKYFFITTMQTHKSAFPSASAYAAPKYEWNSDKQYVKDGDHSLKITRYSHAYQNSPVPVYSETTILSTEYLKQLDLTSVDRESTVIALDVYNILEQSVNVRLNLTDGNGKEVVVECKLTPNGWTTLTMPLTNTFINWKNLIAFKVIFDDWFGIEECSIYIDNVRLSAVSA